MSDALRQLPSVDQLLRVPSILDRVTVCGHDAIADVVRSVLGDMRQAIISGADAPSHELIVTSVLTRIRKHQAQRLQRVINATGVVIHTNLGRAPVSAATKTAMADIAGGYSNLEYDLTVGERGGRGISVEHLLCRLTGAEAALAVNNNASAVLLALTALVPGRGVVISRGQLVEIGGGFRVPDVMRQSGATLIEVGTTNRTHLSDFRNALHEHDTVAALLRAHRSNFRLVGFVTEPTLQEMSDLAHRHDLIVIDDLGSGALLDTSTYGLAHEPTVQESVANGADIVCFSGDKLLGGPQAGLIAGKTELVEKARRHPWARAVRIDKVALVGLQATLGHYAKGEAIEQVPVWQMISRPLEDIERRAHQWLQELETLGYDVDLVAGESAIGGGSLPGGTLPTRWLALSVDSPDAVAQSLRQGQTPVIARIDKNRLLFDPRTVLPGQERTLITCIAEAMAR